MTFAYPFIYTEAWSRFPYCACVGDQTLFRASVPSEAIPEYVDWFRVSSHPFFLPDEGPSAGFGAADSRVEYVSVSIYLFSFICFHYLNAVYYFVLHFANEFLSRIAPLFRMPAIVDMNPRQRQTADLYMEEVRDLFAEWQGP